MEEEENAAQLKKQKFNEPIKYFFLLFFYINIQPKDMKAILDAFSEMTLMFTDM